MVVSVRFFAMSLVVVRKRHNNRHPVDLMNGRLNVKDGVDVLRGDHLPVPGGLEVPITYGKTWGRE